MMMMMMSEEDVDEQATSHQVFKMNKPAVHVHMCT